MTKKKTPAQIARKMRDDELRKHEILLFSKHTTYAQEMNDLMGCPTKIVVQKKPKQKKLRSAVSCRVASKDFLKTFEWRKLRMQALVLYGNTCMCCGNSPKNGAVINVDHIKPRKLFPDLALKIENLQVLCSECNHGKGNWDLTDWRKING